MLYRRLHRRQRLLSVLEPFRRSGHKLGPCRVPRLPDECGEVTLEVVDDQARVSTRTIESGQGWTGGDRNAPSRPTDVLEPELLRIVERHRLSLAAADSYRAPNDARARDMHVLGQQRKVSTENRTAAPILHACCLEGVARSLLLLLSQNAPLVALMLDLHELVEVGLGEDVAALGLVCAGVCLDWRSGGRRKRGGRTGPRGRRRRRRERGGKGRVNRRFTHGWFSASLPARGLSVLSILEHRLVFMRDRAVLRGARFVRQGLVQERIVVNLTGGMQRDPTIRIPGRKRATGTGLRGNRGRCASKTMRRTFTNLVKPEDGGCESCGGAKSARIRVHRGCSPWLVPKPPAA